MKFRCGARRWERKERQRYWQRYWHPFFAIWPRSMTGQKFDCRWLEWIERRRQYRTSLYRAPGWEWEYRPARKK